MSQTFCPIPWKHLATQANGDLRVCCQCTEAPFGKVRRPDGRFFNAASDDDDKFRNEDIFREIRSQMLRGERPSPCQLCWHEESLGKSSRRMDELKHEDGSLLEKAKRLTLPDGSIDINEFPVTHFDLRLGNQCNLKCRSCSPRDSSSWYDDYAKISLEDSFFRRTPPKLDGRYSFSRTEKGWTIDSKDFSWHEDSALLRKIENNPAIVERIYFTGGEPTLIKAHWKLLEKLVEKGRAPHVWLDYNTNASLISDEQLRIWSKFKRVFLGCSIDGIHEKSAYLRPPVEWNVIEKNLEKISRAEGNIEAAFCITISAYNIYYYPEVLEYLWVKNWKNFNLLPRVQMLEHPSWMSAQILPVKTKKLIEERYHSFFQEKTLQLDSETRDTLRAKLEFILSFMHEKDESQGLKTFLRKTDQLDRLRKQNFREILPELYSLLKN